MESEEIIKKTPDYQYLTTSKTKIIPSSKRNLVRGNCQKKKNCFENQVLIQNCRNLKVMNH